MKKLLLTVLAALTLAACAKDDVLVRYEQDMVLIVDGKMLTDNGLTFTVVENDATSEWTAWKRAFITCDVLRKKTETEYDIRLTDARQVLLKEAVAQGDLSEEKLGDDPIDITYGWIAGGYLNLLTRIVYSPASDKPHLINLVYLGEEEGVQRFRLRHNSYGYYFGAPEIEVPLSVGSSYVSFPIERFLPEGKDSVEVEVIWKWHVATGDGLIPETEEKSDRVILRRE